MTGPATGGRRAGGRRRAERSEAPARTVDYRNLKNPFPPMAVFSEDRIAAMHDAALKALEELGIRVLLPEAMEIFRDAGARIVDDMAYLGRDIIEAALASAPHEIHCRAGARDRDVTLALGNLVFQPGAGAPHATDLVRGRRPGSATDFRELLQLTQAFDVLQMLPPLVEPQDVPTHLRHYFTLESQVTLSDKLPFIFARGTPQIEESFEMLQSYRGLSDEDFGAASHCYTIINTNSPGPWISPWPRG